MNLKEAKENITDKEHLANSAGGKLSGQSVKVLNLKRRADGFQYDLKVWDEDTKTEVFRDCYIAESQLLPSQPTVKIYPLQRAPMSEDMIKSMTFPEWTPDRVGECVGRLGYPKCGNTKYVLLPHKQGQKHYITCLACGAVSHL